MSTAISAIVTALAALLAVAGGLHSEATPPPVPPRQPDRAWVFATFNIRYGTANDGEDRWALRRDRCIEALRAMDADVIGLQEALRGQLDEIAAAMPGYEIIGVGRDDGADAGEFCAILVRRDAYTVTDRGTFWLSETPDVPGSRSWGNQITRICTWADLESKESGRRMRVFNAHLDHQSQPSREASAAAIRARIDATPPDRAVVVTGDLNAGPENPAFRVLRNGVRAAGATAPGGEGAAAEAPSGAGDGAGGSSAAQPPASPGSADTVRPARRLQDAWRQANPNRPEQGSFHGFSGTPTRERIDVIFLDDAFVVESATIDTAPRGGRYPSDHFPVIARVRWRTP